MRWDLTNLPLNSPVPHNRDAITGIQWHSNLHYQPLMQCGGAPQIFPLILAGCWGIKLSAIRSCDSCFFPPPPKLKGRSRAVGAQLAFLLAVDASLSSPPLVLPTLLFLARWWYFQSNISFAMAGAIIENMSTKKLVIVGVILLLFQAFAFMVGGLIGKLFFFPFSLPQFYLYFYYVLFQANVCVCTRVLAGI